jgi:peptidyl-prolyl cis-trans isomerase SurA
MLAGFITVLALLAFDSSSATIIDRIAIAVGRRAIKTSDIDRDLRLTAFLNGAPVTNSAAARKGAGERLVDQQLIRQEIATGQYPRATDAEAAELLHQIRSSRFGGSDQRLRAALARYGLSESQLQDQLLWQLTVLRFINDRFRPGVQVSDEQVRQYYDAHLADLTRQYPKDSSFETLEPKIREMIEGDQTNQQFEDWLTAARKNVRIEYHQEALQ